MSLHTLLAITGFAIFALVTVWRAASGAHFNRALRAYWSIVEPGPVLPRVPAAGDRDGRRSA